MNINLSDVIEAIESRDESLVQYYNKKEEIIIYVSDSKESSYSSDDISEIDKYEEWEQEIIKQLYDLKENPKNYIKLPTYEEINEYEIVVRFIESINNEIIKEKIIKDINKHNDLHEVRSTFEKYGVINEWYDFQEEYEKDLAIKWCNENRIKYI